MLSHFIMNTIVETPLNNDLDIVQYFNCIKTIQVEPECNMKSRLQVSLGGFLLQLQPRISPALMNYDIWWL